MSNNPQKGFNRLGLIVVLVLLIVSASVVYVYFWPKNSQSALPPSPTDDSQPEEVEYKNTTYGFIFSLPDEWNGYAIVSSRWEGYQTTDTSKGQIISETGTQIYIRHPLWTAKNPRQDIPIMVFTLSQWADLNNDKFHIGAAPINPSELGRNARYVFALPARYNYAFPIGYEEVELILATKPLHPF